MLGAHEADDGEQGDLRRQRQLHAPPHRVRLAHAQRVRQARRGAAAAKVGMTQLVRQRKTAASEYEDTDSVIFASSVVRR